MLFKKTLRILPFSRIDKGCVFGGYNFVGRNSILKSTFMGKHSYVGNNCVFTNALIGRYSSISSNVEVVTGKHPSHTFVSSHPAFYSCTPPAKKTFVKSNCFEEYSLTPNGYDVEIGNDVWIGRNVLIMGGVTIGDGAIIATGSVVTKNVEAYTIVGGIPAKFIKRRFSEEDSEHLLNIRWWEWKEEVLENNAAAFSNVATFLNKQDF